jgi:hypothetical protein
MSGASEMHYDDEPLYTGKHVGATGTSILKQGADFKSCGVRAGLAVYNDTAGTHGLVVSVTEDAVVTTITFTNGNTFSIYKTSAKDTLISQISTDLRYGGKVERKTELNDLGLKPDDVDVDETERDVFGPGQPERVRI